MKDRISVNPQIHFGKPCVAGTRVLVQNVLELITTVSPPNGSISMPISANSVLPRCENGTRR